MESSGGAVGLTQVDLGNRIARARERASLSQSDLAELVDLTQSAISRIESGDRGVESLELARIAEALNVSAADLLEPEPLAERLRVAARVDEASDPTRVQSALYRVMDLARLDRLLSELGEQGESLSLAASIEPRGKGPIDEGRRAAEKVREWWQLNDDPLPPNLFSLIEDRSGLAVGLEPMRESVAGLCARLDDFATALVDSSVSIGRQRFTVAHELCHFLLGDGDEVIVDERLFGRGHTERRANAFAAHFLMPRKSIERYLRDRPVDGEVAVELHYTFGVSFDALLWHLVNLEHMSQHRRNQLRSIGPKALSVRHGYAAEWEQLESKRGVRRPPRSLHERTVSAYAKGLIGIGPLANLLGKRDIDALRRELEDQGIAYDESWWREAAPA